MPVTHRVRSCFLLLTSASLITGSVGVAFADSSDIAAKVLFGPLAKVEDVVFAVRRPGADGHWYANFSYYAADANRLAYEQGGRLCKLSLRTGKVTVLLDDPEGGVRDPQVHYDGAKMVFSYRKGGTGVYNLHEINVDGSGLRQLTDGPFDDFEPAYLPEGGIVFCSSRCNRWVNCWLTQVAVLYRCDSDGSNIRPISSNIEHDNTPWPLPDGRILYQRWEYVDRSQVHYHHLWTTNPDGTGQMVYYGNLRPGIAMLDAKPIPNTRKAVAIFSPGHGKREHAGAVTIVDPRSGPDAEGSARTINKKDHFRDPYPLSEDCFLVAVYAEIMVMDGRGHTSSLYRLSKEDRDAGFHCNEPRPVMRRERERVIAPRSNAAEPTGRLFLADVYQGRNMAGLERGEIKKLLVLETLPKPINYTGGMEPLSYGGTFTLERILGTVPVEPDGSALFDVPALRPIFFVALDEEERSVKRMQSFTTVQPGEFMSCVGCHEHRTLTALPGANHMAMGRPPSRIEPIEDVPDVFDFPRDIQPILDRHCVPCHGYENRKGGVILTGDRGPFYSHSYFTLSARQQVADGRNRPQSNYPPRGIGSSASPLMQKIEEGHHDVQLSDHEQQMVRLWIDTGAPYPGTYAALGTGMIGGYEQNQGNRADTKWPAVQAATEVLGRRCGTCHAEQTALPTSPSDDRDMPPWAVVYGDPRLRFSRHILYNLTRPDKSLLLLGPLAKEAGGYGVCKTEASEPATVFSSIDDADYGILLAAVQETAKRLDTIKRFDMAGFRPRDAYLREMKRYGILTDGAEQPVDPYALDQTYWESLWYQPGPS